MDMWTTQERCPHAHSLNNKYKSQTISRGLNRPQILPRRHKKGIKVSKAEMKGLDIVGDAFHPEWNYTIRPRQQSP